MLTRYLAVFLLMFGANLAAQESTPPRVAVLAMSEGPWLLRQSLAAALDSALRKRHAGTVEFIELDSMRATLEQLYFEGPPDNGLHPVDRVRLGRFFAAQLVLDIIVSPDATRPAAALGIICVRTGVHVPPVRVQRADTWQALVSLLLVDADAALDDVAAAVRARPANDACY